MWIIFLDVLWACGSLANGQIRGLVNELAFWTRTFYVALKNAEDVEAGWACPVVSRGLTLGPGTTEQCSPCSTISKKMNCSPNVNCSHCSHNTNCSHCSLNVNCSHNMNCSQCTLFELFAQCELFGLFAVRTVRSIVRLTRYISNLRLHVYVNIHWKHCRLETWIGYWKHEKAFGNITCILETFIRVHFGLGWKISLISLFWPLIFAEIIFPKVINGIFC